jgi:hypothetical protein
MTKDYEKQLKFGKEFESEFEEYLKGKNWYVLPTYQYNKIGVPYIYKKNEKILLPDMLAFNNKTKVWFECKSKSHRTKDDYTGYKLYNHQSYKDIQKATGIQVYIIFKDLTKGIPEWYGNSIDILEKHSLTKIEIFEGKKHIMFKYPGAFIKIK